ncbi:MAG: FapA family protein [Spirochaetales bacterium]
MVTLEQLKEFMRQKAEDDRNIRSVSVSAASLEDALASAALELAVPVKRVEFDIVQKGAPGVLGVGRKTWTILAYEAAKKGKLKGDTDESYLPDLDGMEGTAVQIEPGRAFVRMWPEGVFLKVTAPLGSGEPVSEEMALQELHSHGVKEINRQVVRGAVKLQTGTYGKVSDYAHNPMNDTVVNIDLQDGDMQATVTLGPRGPGGADMSVEELEANLKNQGVVYGMLDAEMEALVDSPVYNQKIVVAVGTRAVNGNDARITYFFDTQMKVRPKEIDGRVDFKELNAIRNVLKGEELAKKDPAQKGVPGRTVTGRALPAKDGRDVVFELGNNVGLSKDGLRVVSGADGQVMVLQGKITVETVMIIPGDVDNSVGNINFLGSILVKGSVADGFTVKAVGNIEVLGNVGKSVLETHADIIVHQGINGGGEGRVDAGQNIYSKFIQNATAEAGMFVIVSDGILHSRVIAGQKILCKGKRAKIVGGYLRATEEINASSLGAIGSGETVLEVGIDPSVKEEMEKLNEQTEEANKAYSQVNLNLQSLLKQERVIKILPPDKLAMKKDLTAKAAQLRAQLSKVSQQLEKRRQEVEELATQGKICSSGLVYPGARVIIRDVELEIIREYNSVTFVRDGNLIRTVKYEEIEEEEFLQ